MHDLPAAWRRALVAEVCWLDGHQQPAGMPVTPLLIDGVPCLALPYASRKRAADLRAAPEVAFAVTDARSLPDGRRGVAAVGSVTVTEDLDGAIFTDELLEQELVKYPPSRTLADSLLLRRENWWWLPRLVVRLDRVIRTVELAPRADASRQALLVRNGLGLQVDTVTAPRCDGQYLRLGPLDGQDLRGDTGPALVLGHDYTVPDLERWEPWTLRGRLRGDELEVEQRGGEHAMPLPPLGLLDRIRRRRALEKACRRGIATAEGARG